MRSRSRVRIPLVLLAVSASLLGLGGGLTARAQEAAPTGDVLFGNYDLEARGLGVQARYEIEGLLPGGAPVLDLTVPETLARFGSGPTGYGLASLAYPGGVIVNLPSLVEASGEDASSIPDYPAKAEAFYPAGPTQARAQALGEQQVQSNDHGVDALGVFPGFDGDPILRVESVRSASRSSIEEGKAVSRTRVVVSGVNILGGVITIESLVTDLVAAHDGTAGTADGGTTASGVRFLGLAASLSEDGLVLEEASPASGPAAPLGGALSPAVDPLSPLTGPVRELLKGVLQQAVPSVDDVLAGAGIRLALLGGGPVEVASGASAYRSSGLAVDLTYKGKEQTQLGELIESIPPELRPNIGPLPNPVAFLVENHITGLTLGAGTVSALASPPFEVTGFEGGSVDFDEPTQSFEEGSFEAPGFSTPIPRIPPASRGPAIGDALRAVASGAVPAAALLLLLLAAPFVGIASTRLADNVLAPVSTACPSGLDKPPARPREP